MKIAIMQPYFFPYLGYFSLIKNADRFILFDVVQFIRHGWIERNRVLKPGEGWQYIAVPLEKKGLSFKICDVTIRNNEDWKDKIIRQLEHYRKRSPFFVEAMTVVERALSIQTESIVSLNKHILQKICEYLEIPLNIEIFSEMSCEIEPVTHPGEWALNISRALHAAEYINPPGGVEIFNPEQFMQANIKLSFLGNNLTPYKQRRPVFEPGLSIIDAMMFNNKEEIKALIDDIYYVDYEKK